MDEKCNQVKEDHSSDESTVTREVLPIDYSYSEEVNDQDDFLLPRKLFLDFEKEQEALKREDFMGLEDQHHFVYRNRDAKSEAYRKLGFCENAISKSFNIERKRSFRHVPHKRRELKDDTRRRPEASEDGEQSQIVKRKKSMRKYIGVTYVKRTMEYKSQIYRAPGVICSLGHFKLQVDAAKAYDKAAVLLKREGCKLNFQNFSEYMALRDQEIQDLYTETYSPIQRESIPIVSFRKSFAPNFMTTFALKTKFGLHRSVTTASRTSKRKLSSGICSKHSTDCDIIPSVMKKVRIASSDNKQTIVSRCKSRPAAEKSFGSVPVEMAKTNKSNHNDVKEDLIQLEMKKEKLLGRIKEETDERMKEFLWKDLEDIQRRIERRRDWIDDYYNNEA